MATTTKPCKRCGRILSTNLSLSRGFGPVCWEKEGKFLAMPGRNQELAELKRELASLKAELRALQRSGFTNFKVVNPPNAHMTTPSHNGGSIALMGADIDLDEVKSNPLFLKMQGMAET